MFKYYIIYLLFGAYVAPRSLLSWSFSSFNNCNETVSLIALIASCTLVFVTTPLVLYNLRKARILALVCFAAILPFAVYWLNYIYLHLGFNIDMENRGIFLAACLYLISIIVTLRNINVLILYNALNKRVRFALTILPLIFMAGYCFYLFT